MSAVPLHRAAGSIHKPRLLDFSYGMVGRSGFCFVGCLPVRVFYWVFPFALPLHLASVPQTPCISTPGSRSVVLIWPWVICNGFGGHSASVLWASPLLCRPDAWDTRLLHLEAYAKIVLRSCRAVADFLCDKDHDFKLAKQVCIASFVVGLKEKSFAEATP